MKLFEILNEAKKQEQVATGFDNQKLVWADLQAKFGDGIELISMAKPSQTTTDIKCKINGEEIRIEVKGRQSTAKWNIATDLRMGAEPSDHDLSGEVPKKLAVINNAIKIITGGQHTSLRDYIVVMQKDHKKITRKPPATGEKHPAKPGFAGQEGVSASGHFEIKAPPETYNKFSPILRKLWRDSNDDFVATVMDGKITYYKISGSTAIPGAKTMLPIKGIMIAVVNAAYRKGDTIRTRVGIKFQL